MPAPHDSNQLPLIASKTPEVRERPFTGAMLAEVHQTIRELYLADSRPWIVGYSGGKDSTVTVQLIWYALSQLPREQLHKHVYVISSDTRVETPIIVDGLVESLDRMTRSAQAQGLPISATLVRPGVKDSFWVNMIGKGYPAPYNKFRWCTDRLKIGPANAFIKGQVDKYGEVILALGVRKAESSTRRQSMEAHKRRGRSLSRHSQLVNAWVFTPIEDWTTDNVWTYLLQYKSPWGNNNRDLVAMYKNASGECPLVVDKTTPSCGNSRFGCWTCTVVERDRSMEAAIDNGQEWMQPMLDLRDWLTETRRPEKKRAVRSHRRRSGRIDTWGENAENIIWGPYTMSFRREILRRLLTTQKLVREDGPDPQIELISEDELHEVRRLWRTEEGDWEDQLPGLYREVMGEDLLWVAEADGGATAMEQALLEAVAQEHDLPVGLLKDLVDVERGTRGLARRRGVQAGLDRVLKKDWRTRDEVFADLEARGNQQWEREAHGPS